MEKLDLYSVDASRRILTIRQGKGKKDRIIPVGAWALGWLLRYQHHIRPALLVNPEVTALFVAMDGVAGLTVNGISHTVGAYLKASGVCKWGSCRLLRHAMVTQMLEIGADLRWIQVMLNHTSIESTYVSIGALQAVHASIHPAKLVSIETDEAKRDDV